MSEDENTIQIITTTFKKYKTPGEMPLLGLEEVSKTERIFREIANQVYFERAKIGLTNRISIGLTEDLYKLLRPETEFYKYNVSADEETLFGAKVEIVVGEGLRFWIMKNGCAFKFSEEAEP